jgi:hypothetical protein
MVSCGGDSGGGGVSIKVPGVGSLPDYPTGGGTDPAVIANAAEAQALLTAYFGVSLIRQISDNVEDLIESKVSGSEENYHWSFTNDTSLAGLRVTSSGSGSYKETSTGYSESYASDTSITLTAAFHESIVGGAGAVFYILGGSTAGSKEKVSYTVDLKAEKAKGSQEEAFVYGFTAQKTGTTGTGGTVGKIIISAKASVSGSFDISSEQEPTPTFEGEVKVYGDGATPLLTKPINTADLYDQYQNAGRH